MGRTIRAVDVSSRSVSYKSPHNRGWRAERDRHDHASKRCKTRSSLASGNCDVAILAPNIPPQPLVNPHIDYRLGRGRMERMDAVCEKQASRRGSAGAFVGHRSDKVVVVPRPYLSARIEDGTRGRSTSTATAWER